MEKTEITNGVWLVEVPDIDLSILCGCPPDVIKHLMKRGLISKKHYEKGLHETGPNAILLSDLPLQGGEFSNLAEFPILQMFYRQGMIVPGHPGNTGRKPLILGLKPQLDALSEYLFRGTYGLESLQEILDTGVQKDFAEEILRIKLWFAFNKIRRTEDLVDMVPLDSGEASLRNGLLVVREAVNVYRFSYEGNSVQVDLNLPSGKRYKSPVTLGSYRITPQYFSVVHIGEGDGWDPHRPCMASIVTFQGRIYLIDTGPNILESLTALGISVNEIEGIFHTHAHDDHFAGLTSLVRTDHRIKYYATPLVRATVMKKLSAIMGIPEKRFTGSFEIHDMKHGVWNNISGLEVKPVFSPHPVETNILYFRAMWDGDYKTYAHFADIAAFEVLDRMCLQAEGATPLSKRLYDSFTEQLVQKADLKKIDIGGGMIHGAALDFEQDPSSKIVLAHIDRDLTPEEKEIGSGGAFGQEDVLIPRQIDYGRQNAKRYLRSYFPDAAGHDIAMLLNCPIHDFNAEYLMVKKGEAPDSVFVVVHGVAEVVNADMGIEHMLSAGTIIGEYEVLTGRPAVYSYRARSAVRVLALPKELYRLFVQRNSDLEAVIQVCEIGLFMQTTWLFGEFVASPVLHRIIKEAVIQTYYRGEAIEIPEEPLLILVRSGSAELLIDKTQVAQVRRGDFFGEESIFYSGGSLMSAVASTDVECYYIPGTELTSIPIVEWKMLETYERRISAYAQLSQRDR